MTSDTEGSLSLALTPEDTAVYFIIAAMPSVFEDENPDFQLFPYEMQISLGVVNVVEDLQPSTVIRARYNLQGQEVEENTPGLQFLLYVDGRVEKVVVQSNR